MATGSPVGEFNENKEDIILGSSVLETDCQEDGEDYRDGAQGSFREVSGALRQRRPRRVNEEQYVGIVTPEQDQEFTPFLEGFLQLVSKINNRNVTKRDLRSLPVGVRLVNDETIYLSTKKKYRENKEFTATGRVLGTGETACVRVVKDEMNAIEHALKSVHLSEFKENEIRCWVDQNETGYVPKLYMFQVRNNHVLLHMEILEDAISIKCLISNRDAIFRERLSLLKPLAHHVKWLLLAVINKFHETGWTHNDLHWDNVMLKVRYDEPLKVYILDFSTAEASDDIDCDMQDIDILFTGLSGDANQNVSQNANVIFSEEDKELFAELIAQCSFIVQKNDIPRYIKLLGQSRENAIDAIISPVPGGIEYLPKLPSPRRSPVGNEPRASLIGNESITKGHLDIIENALEMEGQAIMAHNSLDGRGDELAILSQPMADIKLHSTNAVSLMDNATANNEQATVQHENSRGLQTSYTTTFGEVSFDRENSMEKEGKENKADRDTCIHHSNLDARGDEIPILSQRMANLRIDLPEMTNTVSVLANNEQAVVSVGLRAHHKTKIKEASFDRENSMEMEGQENVADRDKQHSNFDGRGDEISTQPMANVRMDSPEITNTESSVTTNNEYTTLRRKNPRTGHESTFEKECCTNAYASEMERESNASYKGDHNLNGRGDENGTVFPSLAKLGIGTTERMNAVHGSSIASIAVIMCRLHSNMYNPTSYGYFMIRFWS